MHHRVRVRCRVAPTARLLALLLVGVAHLSSPTVAASKSKAVPCADGAFQVQGAPLVAGAATPQAGTLRVKASSRPAIDIGCGAPDAARVVSKRTFDQVTAKWKRCGGLARVRLTATLAKPDCSRVSGVLKAKKATPKQFVALRFTCGDGLLDVAAGEACDVSVAGGDAACPGRCSAGCLCVGAGVTTTTTTTTTPAASTTSTTAPCVPATEVCDGADNDCDGTIDDGSDLCVLPHATGACSAGSCQVAACDGAFRDCDGLITNGCETETSSEPDHCGACGTQCVADNLCANGICLPPCDGAPGESCVTVEGEGLDARTNDDVGTPTPMIIGGAIDGTIGNPIGGEPDVDLYAFEAVAGDVLRATISTRAGGAYEAFGRIIGDGRILRVIRPGDDTSFATREFVVARSGTYRLWIDDRRNVFAGDPVGGASFTYRAQISRVARMPDAATVPIVREPASVPATGDVALLSFDAQAGQEISAATFAESLPTPSAVDTFLLLFDASTVPPTLLAENDDQDGTTDSSVGVTAPTNGQYLLVVDTYDVTGLAPEDRQYELTLATPCFHCVEALLFTPDPGTASFCPGSFDLLRDVAICLCGDGGQCHEACASYCAAGTSDDACDACYGDPAGCLPAVQSCEGDFAPNVCGDGFVRGGEACDDLNAADGDGCSSSCAVEPGFTCGGQPSSCASCGDGEKNGSETDVDCGGGCPACGPTKTCTLSQDCTSGSCLNGTCACPETFHVFALFSSTAGIFETAQWPGGTQTFQALPGCAVTIANPSGGINSLVGDSFAVTQVQGFSACAGVSGEDGDGCQPGSCPPLGIGSCLAARPLCTLAGNGSGSATYGVLCSP